MTTHLERCSLLRTRTPVSIVSCVLDQFCVSSAQQQLFQAWDGRKLHHSHSVSSWYTMQAHRQLAVPWPGRLPSSPLLSPPPARRGIMQERERSSTVVSTQQDDSWPLCLFSSFVKDVPNLSAVVDFETAPSWLVAQAQACQSCCSRLTQGTTTRIVYIHAAHLLGLVLSLSGSLPRALCLQISWPV